MFCCPRVFKKRNGLPLIQEPLESLNFNPELRKPLQEVIDEIEKTLESTRSLCGITRSLPLLPIQATELKKDGRMFTPDVSDLIAMLRSLNRKQKNPYNGLRLTIKDLQKYFFINENLIKQIQNDLQRNHYSFDELLKEFSVSKELFQFLREGKYFDFMIKPVSRPRNNPVVEISDVLDDDKILRNLIMVLVFAAIVLLKFYYDNFKPELHLLLKQLIDLKDKITFTALVSNSSMTIFKAFELGRASVFPVAVGVSTALVAREANHLSSGKKSWSDNSKQHKLLILFSLFCISLLGLDALTDSLGVVSSLSRNTSFSRTTIGLAPFAYISLSGLFGKLHYQSKGERDFIKLMKNNFDCKK